MGKQEIYLGRLNISSFFIHFRQVERKRARNRVAASKCRMRKLERIAVLDHQANQLRTENEQLVKLADKLRSQVYSLKQELRWHINNGCRLEVRPCAFYSSKYPKEFLYLKREGQT